MTDASLRRVWLVSAVSLALWSVSVLSFVGYLAALGPSSVQRRATDQLTRDALESGVEPLVALLGVTTALGTLAVLSLLYYSYAQWRYAARRRRRLESLSASGSSREGDRKSAQ